jgi:hypothetical protein
MKGSRPRAGWGEGRGWRVRRNRRTEEAIGKSVEDRF